MLIMLALNGQKAQFRYPILKIFLTKWTLSKLSHFEHIICPTMVAFDRNYARLCSFSLYLVYNARLCFFYKKGLLCLKIMPAYSAQAKFPLKSKFQQSTYSVLVFHNMHGSIQESSLSLHLEFDYIIYFLLGQNRNLESECITGIVKYLVDLTQL